MVYAYKPNDKDDISKDTQVVIHREYFMESAGVRYLRKS